MSRYVWHNGKWVEWFWQPPRARLQVMRDIEPFVSPCSDPRAEPIVVGSRSAKREDLKRNGCREVDPSEKKAFMSRPKPAKDNWEELVQRTAAEMGI